MGTIVLVGLRSPALGAAERLGLRVVAVVEAPPGPRTAARLAGVVEAPFDAPDEAWAETARALAPHRPDAVVALTERSVVPAAHLRAALGLGGLTTEAARCCTDKAAMKRAVRAAGIACTDWVEAAEGLGADALVERLGLPLVLKSAVGSGGRGTRVAHTRADVPDRLPPGGLAEAFVDGVEMSVEQVVVGGRVRFANPTQYLVPGWASVVPAPLPADALGPTLALADAARQALGVTDGMTHVEVFQTPGGPVFGELAARPPGGHLMALIRHAYGVDPWETLLRTARGEAPDLPLRAGQAAAVWILHPGEGTVRTVAGVEAARALPGVAEVACRVAPGDAVRVRAGTGEEVGHLVVTGATAAEAEARLRTARAALQIEVAA